jgi:WD40 repeat protein
MTLTEVVRLVAPLRVILWPLPLVLILFGAGRRAAADEPVVLRGHERGVSGLAFAPDGRSLTSCSFDGTVKLWDSATGKERMTLRGHTKPVTAISLSPDGKTLASAGGYDLTLKCWDVATGKEKATLTGHTDAVWAVTFAPDGKTLASASGDRTIRLWDVAAGKETRSLDGHTRFLRALAFLPDGRALISCGAAGLHVWDAATGKERPPSRHQEPTFCLAVSPDGKTVAAGTAPVGPEVLEVGRVVFWDPATDKDKATLLAAFRDVVSALAFSPDGKLLAVGKTGKVQLWDVSRQELLVTLRGHTKYVAALAFSPDGKVLASGSYDNTIRLWDVAGHLERKPEK